MDTDPNVMKLIEQGFHVHACCPPNHHEIEVAANKKDPCPETSSGKVPYDIKRKCHLWDWNQAAPLTLADFQRFSKMNPQPNVGLKLGDGLVRVDIDSEIGEEHLRKQELPLPDSWEFTSGRGRGILYHTPLDRRCKKKTPYEDVELLGAGEQTIIPPSRHRRGTTYEWKPGHAPTEIPLADVPDWITGYMEVQKVAKGAPTVAHAEQATGLSGLERCKKWQEALTVQKADGLDEETWFRWTSFLVSVGHADKALNFSRLSKKCDPRSEGRIVQLIEKRDAQVLAGEESEIIHPVRCTSFGCDHDRIFECFGKLNVSEQDEATNSPCGFLVKQQVLVNGYQAPDAYFERVEHKNMPATFKFLHGVLVADILDNEHFIALGDDGANGPLYYADHGIYRQGGEVFIRTTIEAVLGTWARTLTKNQRNEVIDGVRNHSYRWERNITDDPDLISCPNGVLNWRTLELRPYDLDQDIFFSQLPIDFDPKAKSPRIDSWLDEITDLDTKQTMIDIPTQALYRRPRKDHHACIGPPDSAKTLYSNFITEILGKDNVSSIPLQHLIANTFAPVALKRKWMNICDDIGSRKVSNVAAFNAQTGGGRGWAEKKHQQGESADPSFAKHLYLGNKMPPLEVIVGETADDILAFFRRIRVFRLTQVFARHPKPGTDEKQAADPDDLLKGLTTTEEKSGFLNVMLARLPIVVKEGPHATVDAQESMMMYMRSSNSFQAFFIECCVRDRKVRFLKSTMRAFYKRYCDEYICVEVSDKVIKETLSNSGIGSARESGKGREHCWVGVKIVIDPTKLTDEEKTLLKEGTKPNVQCPTLGESVQGPSKEHPDSQSNDGLNVQHSTTSSLIESIHTESSNISMVDIKAEKAGHRVRASSQQSDNILKDPGRTLDSIIPADTILRLAEKGEKVTDDTKAEQSERTKDQIEADNQVEIAEREEARLVRTLGKDWSFVSRLIDDCAEAIRLDEGKNWGAFQIRAYAQRFKPIPSAIIVDMLVNDESYQQTLKKIAMMRNTKAQSPLRVP